MTTTDLSVARGLLERIVPSKSVPGKYYRMVWAPVSGWVHADSTCPSYKECWHRKEAENMTSLVVRGSQEVQEQHPVLLVEYDAQALSAGVDVEIAAKWAYDLPGGGGKGVGVRGAEEGVRLLASRGEVIRVDSVTLVSQDERDAFFQAVASRYVINPETGIEVKLDSQTRGKRVSKLEEHSASYMRDHPDEPSEYFNKNWYEVGMVKAARNAALAMMPSNVKTALLRAGLDAAAELRNNRNPQRQQPVAPANRPQQVSQPQQRQVQDALTMFWTDARNAKLDQDAVIDASQRLYNNREPKDLTPQERIELLRQLTTRPEDVAQQAPLTS